MSLLHRIHSDESGLSTLERIGVVAIIITVLSFIPPVRSLLGDFYDLVFKQRDEAGEITQFSIAARGILITVLSIAIFNGLGWLILATNLGKRLAFLVGGAATFGWLAIGGLLFVIYAPRGIRPANLEGLNAFEIRIPAIAVTVGSFILFMMFVIALDRYEKEAEAA